MIAKLSIDAEPYEFTFEPAKCALLIIDMQRDFLDPGGFGEMLGNDVSQLRRTIEPNVKLLAGWRAAGLQVLHTREGHRDDLPDLPPAKKIRARSATSIGDSGPMGRILVRGQSGHDILGYSQIHLRDGALHPFQRDALTTISSSSDHFLRLINEILDLSKIDAGRMELTPSDFDLVALVRELAAMFEHPCEDARCICARGAMNSWRNLSGPNASTPRCTICSASSLNMKPRATTAKPRQCLISGASCCRRNWSCVS